MKSATISSLLLPLLVTTAQQTHAMPSDPVPCATDDDCSSSAWCRPTDLIKTNKVCVAYLQEGDSCGGFFPFWLRNKCHPLTTCIPDDERKGDSVGTCVANIITPGPDMRFQEMAVDSLKDCLIAAVHNDESTTTADDLDMSALLQIATFEVTTTSCGDIGVEFDSAHVRVLRRSGAEVLAEVQYDCDGNEVSPQCNVSEDVASEDSVETDSDSVETDSDSDENDSDSTENDSDSIENDIDENDESDESTTSSNLEASTNDELSDDAIVGLIVAAGVLGVGIVVALVYCMGKKPNNNLAAAGGKASDAGTNSDGSNNDNDNSDGNDDDNDDEDEEMEPVDLEMGGGIDTPLEAVCVARN